MPDSELDNPFWSSLQTRHRAVAVCDGQVARYPAAFAPFIGVAQADARVGDALARLVGPEENLLLLGVAPRVCDGWMLETFAPLAQMIRTAPLAVIDGPPIVELSAARRADVLELTALVYPHYFRERTMELGRYFGMYMPDRSGVVRLAAMIGERLGTATHVEMSAICTHPDFEGRGYARRLIASLTNDTLAHGCTPFLHVSRENTRALRLYERIGYGLRRDIGFWSLRRTV